MQRFLFLLSLLAAVGPMRAFDVYVAPNGADTNPGTLAQPLATIAAAQRFLATLRASGTLPSGPVTVWLRAGSYDQPGTLAFTAADSGTAAAPVVYSSYAGEEAHVTGAITLDPTWFSPVTSASPVWSRLDPSAQGQVYQVNLSAHGINNWGTLQPRGFSLRAPAPMELFVNGQPMTLARWPNVGQPLAVTQTAQSPTQFTYTGNRPSRWSQATDIWMQGFWSQNWADFHVPVGSINPSTQTVTLASAPAQYGIAANQPFYAYNLLEELDTPGEYYLDRTSGILYYWPTTTLTGAVIQASLLETPIVALTGTSYLAFKGLVFEAARGALVTVTGGNNVVLDHCLLRNAGQFGVQIASGTSHGVTHSQIAFCGEEGVRVSGGDRPSLTAGNNYVTHSQIHATGRIDWSYKPAINLEDGSGNRATNNLIDDLPHAAILFTGNNHLMAYNEIWHVCQVTSDAGAIYCGRQWGYRGNVIEYNYLHDISSSSSGGADVNGVYLDDCLSGVTVYSNIFYRISGTAIFCGGGRDNLMTNNLIADCGTGHYNDDRGVSAIDNVSGDAWNLLQTLGSDNVQYQSGAWTAAYAACAAIPNSWTSIQQGLWRNPQNCVFSHNAGWNNSAWTFQSDSSNTGVFSVYADMSDNNAAQSPVFGAAEAEDRTLRAATLAAGSLASFTPVPFAAIGPDESAEPAAVVPPGAPLLTGATQSASSVELDWTLLASTADSSATGFALQYLNGGVWTPFETVGGEVDFSAVSGLSAATAYTFRIVATNAAGSATSSPLTLTTAAAPLQAGTAVEIDAGSPLSIVTDLRNNGTIGVQGASQNTTSSVRMYDAGDTIRINFTAATAGAYQLGLRVRSGGSTGPTSFWPGGYSAQLDGTAVSITGDSTSLSTLDSAYGGCFWGTMVSAPLTLAAGSHSLLVTANSNWAAVAALDVTPLLAAASGAADAAPVALEGASAASASASPSATASTGSASSDGSTPSSGSSSSAAAAAPAAGASLPNSVDIGSVNTPGTSADAGGVYTLTGSGADIWNTTIGFHFDYQTLTGDGVMVARVDSLQATDPWAKTGVMIRASLDPQAAYAAVFATSGNGIAFQWGAGSGASSNSASAVGAAPYWVRLTRAGTTFTADCSSDGVNWTNVGSATVTMGATVEIGLAVTSHNAGAVTTATFDSVNLTGVVAEPESATTAATTAGSTSAAAGSAPAAGTTATSSSSATAATGATTASSSTGTTSGTGTTTSATAASSPGWTSADIGSVAIAGSSSVSANGVYTVSGSGADIWNSTIGFQSDYQTLSGDGSIVAQVTSLQATDSWAKAGVMIRDTTAAQAAYAAAFVTAGSGLAFQGGNGNGSSSWSIGAAANSPCWVRLTRAGNTFTADCSPDGSNWTNVGVMTVPMGTSVCIGLAVTSHNQGQATTATFASVALTGSGTGTSAPATTGSTPAVTAAGTAAGTTSSSAPATTSTSTSTAGTPAATSSSSATSTAAAGSASSTGTTASSTAGSSTASVVTSSSAASTPGVLSSPWSNTDIGTVAIAGTSTVSGSVYTLTGSGPDIWGTSVGFQYASQLWTGDGTIIARVSALQNTDPWAKAGVMMRVGTDAAAPYVAVFATPGNGLAFQWRNVDGWDCYSNTTAGAAPAWVRLTRAGGTFTAYTSTDGVNWTSLGSASITVNYPVSFGLAVTSHNHSVAATAVFESVSVSEAAP